jgi:hypothetical protein
MNAITLELSRPVYRSMWKHLLPRRQCNEEAAFCFARPMERQEGMYKVIDWRRIVPSEFEYQSGYHLELGDQVRAEIIKQAHDLSASIIEFHSHLWDGPPEFSWSDVQGFGETVPHCLWRLKGRPYFAVVVSKGGFDGLAWFMKEGPPAQLGSIRSGSTCLNASCKTLRKL